MYKIKVLLLGFATNLLFGNILFAQSEYNILDFGATGDGATDNREAIQNTIDKAYKAGGGRVIVPPGKFLSGGIELKDNFDLKFKHDYSLPRQTELSVLYGEGLHDGILDNPLVSSSNGKLQKYKLENSSIKIRD